MRKLGLLVFVSFLIGCSSDSDGDSPDMPMNSVDQGMNDMSETVDAMVEVSTISVEPVSLTVPESTPGMPVRVSFAVNADGSVASITNVTMTINGGIARLFYRATSQIGIDTDGEDRFDYPINVEPGTALPMMLEVAPSGDAAITGSIEISGNFENSPMSVSVEQGGRRLRLRCPRTILSLVVCRKKRLRPKSLP